MAISIIIPTYRSPEHLDLCLKSCIEQQSNANEIIVVVDGFYDESKEILDKYEDRVNILDLGENQGMQMALNYGVMNATNEKIFIVNDDNVFCKDFDVEIEEYLQERHVLTLNQIEPEGPGIFNFPVKDFGRNPKDFKYNEFIKYEPSIRKDKLTLDGGIFPFAMYKKYYLAAGGFDTIYKSPFICDWDFFLKLELIGLTFLRTSNAHLYHFGSSATKNGKDGIKFKESEQPAANIFMYKWGIPPQLFENNSHNPKNNKIIKGIKYD
jgi:glycosyltransferase involved in cell wall biosynthesis|tara:strand:- start:400 stop:1200 length:801 start_codon:yes stop_codon:yes gene_type:complete